MAPRYRRKSPKRPRAVWLRADACLHVAAPDKPSQLVCAHVSQSDLGTSWDCRISVAIWGLILFVSDIVLNTTGCQVAASFQQKCSAMESLPHALPALPSQHCTTRAVLNAEPLHVLMVQQLCGTSS